MGDKCLPKVLTHCGSYQKVHGASVSQQILHSPATDGSDSGPQLWRPTLGPWLVKAHLDLATILGTSALSLQIATRQLLNGSPLPPPTHKKDNLSAKASNRDILARILGFRLKRSEGQCPQDSILPSEHVLMLPSSQDHTVSSSAPIA
jgi:hypothetical protein